LGRPGIWGKPGSKGRPGIGGSVISGRPGILGNSGSWANPDWTNRVLHAAHSKTRAITWTSFDMVSIEIGSSSQ
jgi:hypothetical protein